MYDAGVFVNAPVWFPVVAFIQRAETAPQQSVFPTGTEEAIVAFLIMRRIDEVVVKPLLDRALE